VSTNVGLLLTVDFGTDEFTLVQESIVVTGSFSFVGMIVLGENSESKQLDLSPKQLDLSSSLKSSGFIATA